MNYTNSIREYLNRDIEAFNKLNIEEINTAMEAIYHAWERGSTIYVMGNGEVRPQPVTWYVILTRACH